MGNDLTLGVTQKVECFAVSINRISEYSPVSVRDGVLLFIKSAIPPSIVSPNFLSFLPKLKVTAISSSRPDVNDGKRNGVLAARTIGDVRRIWVWRVAVHGTGGLTRFITAPQPGIIVDFYRTEHTWTEWRIGGKRTAAAAARASHRERIDVLATFLGTGGMTRLTTAPQLGIIGDRRQTDHTWFGLSHQTKGSITCWASGLRTGSSMGLTDGVGRWVFIEKQRVPWEGNEPMRGRPHDALGGEGVGDPPPPSLVWPHEALQGRTQGL